MNLKRERSCRASAPTSHRRDVSQAGNLQGKLDGYLTEKKGRRGGWDGKWKWKYIYAREKEAKLEEKERNDTYVMVT